MAQFCAACHTEPVWINLSGEAAEFCSNKCRKAAVDRGMVEACVNCGVMPKVMRRGVRENYCGRMCKNEHEAETRGTGTGTGTGRQQPLCQFCHNQPCYRGSSYCSVTCRDSARSSPSVPVINRHVQPRAPPLQNPLQIQPQPQSQPHVLSPTSPQQAPLVTQQPSQVPSIAAQQPPQAPLIAQQPPQAPLIAQQLPQVPLITQQPPQVQILINSTPPTQQPVNVPQPMQSTIPSNPSPPPPAPPLSVAILPSEEEDPPPSYSETQARQLVDQKIDRIHNEAFTGSNNEVTSWPNDQKITRDDNYDSQEEEDM